MDKDKAIILFQLSGRGESYDLEVPLDISANEFVLAMNSAYNLHINISDLKTCYLSAENPIVLLRGNRTLKEFGVRNGTIINYAEQEPHDGTQI